jgi:diaminopimelate decarboxylase
MIGRALSVPAANSLSHVYPIGSTVNEHGHLEVGGCDTLALAAEFGTPAYVVAEDDLRARARAYVDGLRAVNPDGDVLFASKAFPCTAVYRLLAGEGLSCDVASGGELALALRGGFDPARIYLHGNAKSIGELTFALDAGVGHVVLDSLDDIERLESVAARRGVTQDVLIRVTPDVSGDTHAAISTGQADSKFGFGLAEAPRAIDRLAASPRLRLVGLHCHIGSQLLTLEPFALAVQALATLGDFDVYNLGGGLGVAYLVSQEPPSISDYIATLAHAAQAALGPGKRILIEPGRSLVANSTVTLYTVQTVKRNVSTWVAVDGGMSDNLRPMLYGSRYEVAIAGRMLDTPTDVCHLAGKHCESGDVIARDVELAKPQPGDVVVTPATGAYGHAMANNYNGVPRPPVIFCSGGNARVVVRRETYEDLAARDIDPAARDIDPAARDIDPAARDIDPAARVIDAATADGAPSKAADA